MRTLRFEPFEVSANARRVHNKAFGENTSCDSENGIANETFLCRSSKSVGFANSGVSIFERTWRRRHEFRSPSDS